MNARDALNLHSLVLDPDAPQQRYVVASDVSLEDYLDHFAERHCEYVDGEVIAVMPIQLRHEQLRDYLRLLFQYYLSMTSSGMVLGEPFIMRTPKFPTRRREPDLMIVLNDRLPLLKETEMAGAANIVIEIVSPGSVAIDYGEKFEEYEAGGVGEYWIIDYLRRTTRFYTRTSADLFGDQLPDAEGWYRTGLLPQFGLHVPTLWSETLPGPLDALEGVRAMLGS